MNVNLLPFIVVLAFVCELIDSTLGMGYGTTLTPVLLLLGYQPSDIVPAVLLSEFATGILAGIFHQEFGNVDFHPGTRDFKVTALMSALSVVGVLAAVIIAIRLPAWSIKLYIGLLTFSIGLIILRNRTRTFAFSWKRIAGLGALAAFNKGISGGGYGPVVTGGQVLSGVEGNRAVGIASLAEGVTSAVGFVAYLLGGAPFPWLLAPSLLLGAIASTPLAAYAVSKFSPQRLTIAIGSVTLLLGGYTLFKIFV